ncbi:MAG: hypothetical protein LAT63_05955 [Marinobacter sp.]|nr:hypothetical protein [Marinobacter sp.]
MKVTIYVWPMHQGNVVHASLRVHDSRNARGTYISFWPDDGIGKPQAKKGLKLKLSHRSTSVALLEHDIEAEGGRKPLAISIEPVDVQAIITYWAEVQKEPYQLRTLNCSSIVAECIHRGSGKPPSFKPSAEGYSRFGKVFGYGMWTPLQVMRYAQEVANGSS